MPTVTPPTITALPAPPDPNNRATFNTLAYPWSVAQQTLATQVGAVATNVKANADDAATSASAANTSKLEADADALATAADRVQTGSDRTQTGLDRTAAAASAVQASKLNLGNKTSAPALDNQGAALLTGATYYDTTLNKWRVWSGSAWADGISAVAGVSTVNGAAGAVVNIATTGANIFTAAQNHATGAGIASAATINLDTATGNRVNITGITTITAVTLTRGPRTLIFNGVLTLTHNATSNNLPGAANITTAVGDRAIYESDGTTVYCVSYTRANGQGVVSSTNTITDDLTTIDFSITTASAIGNGPFGRIITLDANRELILITGSTSLHAVVYNATLNTLGTPALINTGNFSNSFVALLIDAEKILICSIAINTTLLQTVVITTADLAITVGTPVSTTLADNSRINARSRLLAVGTSYVVDYENTALTACLRAITVAGTTPTVGAQTALTGASFTYIGHAVSSSVMLAVSCTSTVLQALPITVSGAALTSGTQATTTTSTTSVDISMQPLSTGRWAVLFINNQWQAGVITVTGTTATLSIVNTAQTPVSFAEFGMRVFGAQAFIFKSGWINVLTDTAGTASIGTTLGLGAGIGFGYTSTGLLFSNSGVAGEYTRVGISGSDAIVNDIYPGTIETTSSTVPFGQLGGGYGGVSNGVLRTSAGKHAATNASNANNRPFGLVTSGTRVATRCNNPGIIGQPNFPAYAGESVLWSFGLGQGNKINARRIKLT